MSEFDSFGSAPSVQTTTIEISWNLPYTPSPIDFGRRRQHPLYINKVKSTMSVKRPAQFVVMEKIAATATAAAAAHHR